MKVLIVVTHLLGTGHLSRALTLGRAFASFGHDVSIASGGVPVPHLDHAGMRLVQLPPLRSDGTNFGVLLTPDGSVAGDSYLARRRADLIDTLSPRPDLIVTELFPFGRRILRAEFLALLEAARGLDPRPRNVVSIRDILDPPSKPARAQWTAEIIERYYDAVLVHADPAIADLSLSWPVGGTLEPKLRYTGYVAPPPAGPHPETAGREEVIVSAGGGAVGQALFGIAAAAARSQPHRTWRLLVGGRDGPAHRAALARGAPANLRVDATRPDFRQMLYHAACSVGLCGYNTALDILQAGTPAIFVPFDAGTEVEQGLRARALSALPAIEVLQNRDLTPETLAASVDRLVTGGRRPEIRLRDSGAAETVRICRELVGVPA